MDLLMAIGFFIMFLVILGVLIYLIYDYIAYKKTVDETVEQMKRRINRSNVRIQRGYNENASILNNATSNILMNRQDLVDFDNGLKNMFTLTSNDYPVNTSIFDYIMNADPDNNVYKMKLLKRVEAVSGMRVEVGNAANKNFQFCSNNACLNLQMTDSKFKITPSGTNNLEITAANAARSPMANFDFANNSIYLGGDTAASSAMYLDLNATGGVIVDSSKFKFKGTGDSSDVPLQTILQGINTKFDGVGTTLQAVNNAIYSSYSNVEFIAQYAFTNTPITSTTNGVTTTTNTNILNVTIVPLYDIVFDSDKSINVYIQSSDIATWYNTTPTPQQNTLTSPVSTVTKLDSTNVFGFVVTFSANLTKNTSYTFSYSKAGASPIGVSMPITGSTIPIRTKFPTSYPLSVARSSLDSWHTPAR